MACRCCVRKRPFEMAMILILLVCIIFLIAMILIYALHNKIWLDIHDCKGYCAYLQRCQISCISRDIKCPSDSGQSCGVVAALIDDLYDDDSDEKFLRCSVSMVGKQYAITSSDCIEDKDNLDSMYCRVESGYWSKGGALLKIDNVNAKRLCNNLIYSELQILHPQDYGLILPFPSVILLRLEKPVPTIDSKRNIISDFFPGPNFQNSMKSLIWNSNFSLASFARKKYSTLKEIPMILEPCSRKYVSENNICTISTKSVIPNLGAPLLDYYGKLIGVHLFKYYQDNHDVFVYFPIKAVSNWVLSIIQNDV